jgi:hypothetical protein
VSNFLCFGSGRWKFVVGANLSHARAHIFIVFITHTQLNTSVAEPHHFYAALAPAPGENFDAALAPAALAPALAPTPL